MHAEHYLRGLLAPLERKNGWTIAEYCGQHEPKATQRLLNLTDWADNQHPAGRERENPAETRLPVGPLAPLLRPTQRCRTGFATAKDPASNDIARGWYHLMGLAPSCCSLSPCSPSATSESSPPGTPARKKTPAAPPGACRPEHANAAARPSPALPPGRPDSNSCPQHCHHQEHRPEQACPQTPRTRPEQQKGHPHRP